MLLLWNIMFTCQGGKIQNNRCASGSATSGTFSLISAKIQSSSTITISKKPVLREAWSELSRQLDQWTPAPQESRLQGRSSAAGSTPPWRVKLLLVVDRHKLTVFYLKSFDMDSVQVFLRVFLDLFWLSHVHLGVNGCHRKVSISNVKK